MMSVLIIYDGWQKLKLIDVFGVIIGPVLAMFLAHVFSAAMAKHVELGRILTGKEWKAIVQSEAPFLLLCGPPLAIVTVLYALAVPGLPMRFGPRCGSVLHLWGTGDSWLGAGPDLSAGEWSASCSPASWSGS